MMSRHKTKYLKDYRPAGFTIDHIDLRFDIWEDRTEVTSVMEIRRNQASEAQPTALELNKGVFKITRVVAGGMVLIPDEYQADDQYFRLANTPEAFCLEITSILDPAANTTLEGLYRSGNILCTQCEAEGFRKITPYLDRPDVMTVFSCTITADKTQYPVLLSNGNLTASGDLEGNRHYVRWEDPHKKPSYLFALVAGDLALLQDRFTTASGRPVTLNIYSEKENIGQCSHAMHSLKQAMKWDEERFGLEYDLDLYQIVAINDFNAGAMENKGLNIFNAKYVLADTRTATDEDFTNIQAVIAHEYFHNWTGNRVTLKNWFQLSLKEGLTVFRDQEFSSDMNSRAVKRLTDVKNLRALQFPEDAGPMTHPVRPESYIKMDNFYTMTVYEKGAELVRMIYQLLGKETFRKGMDLYFERHDGMAVTIEDFLAAMAAASGRDLTQFKRWYSQSGTPRVSLGRQYDPDQQTLTLTFTQDTRPDRNQAEKQPLHIPIQLGLLAADGKETHGSRLFELTAAQDHLRFENVAENAIPSVLREFSAPVRLETDFTDQDLAFLMANDTDGFNQWDAAQTLFVREIKKQVSEIRNSRTPVISTDLVQAFGQALSDPDRDRAFLARALALPQETELKDHFDIIDVTAIHQARTQLQKSLAHQFRSQFQVVYNRCGQSDPADISHQAMADRSLRNLCLSYLSALDDAETRDMARHQFETSGNMTDEFAAFRILTRISPEIRDEAVLKFHEKWQMYSLVLDKWFAAQAVSPLDDTLEQVSALTRHPDFSMTTPNKVRALVYAFAMQNPIHFHRADGRGYAFIRDKILELDTINHNIAARLATSFNLWKRYDTDRQALMKACLEKIMAKPDLSRNVYEIVSRALE